MKHEKTITDLRAELEELRHQLLEAHETIDAIRTGQVDALILESNGSNELYTLKTADIAYRVFIEKMTEGAVTLSRDGFILYCNQQFAVIVNHPLSAVIGSSFRVFIADEDLAAYDQLFENCWQQDSKEEIRLKNSHTGIPVQLSMTALQIEGTRALSIIITDLSAQKKTQLQLEEANRKLQIMNKALEESNHDLQQFASIASHDLQEPLRKVQMFSNMLLEKNEELHGDSKRFLDKILDATRRMKILIVDVLNYSRLSARDPMRETVDLNKVVNELLEDLELIILEKKAVVRVGELPSIAGNKGQIRQVFQNLLSNALKFTRADHRPVIDITAQTVAEKYAQHSTENSRFTLIRVKDNGIGFEEKYLENIFALFERLHTKDKFEGTGIGLAIARKIIEKHGGAITAQSKIGAGAEFLIWLPMQ
ncbi:PAS domain-containing sensor histidine kinase [Niastella koreensis]|uniref:histidine kinase n=2 Tax=Niastella koreensis TaxID=354356 RepID=G8TFS4_NIAKG|nr:ATP-binding protein [Niastella koreensis]AEV99513.1 PAS/PAC sensor signal transduction histidine kinase [Niastella koreensis GR20-10]OQP50105.1 PAS domain-containing sensor histidine kinase [Niastella koreensis]